MNIGPVFKPALWVYMCVHRGVACSPLTSDKMWYDTVTL